MATKRNPRRERTVARLMGLATECAVAVHHWENDTTEATAVWLLDEGTKSRLERALRRALPPDATRRAK